MSDKSLEEKFKEHSIEAKKIDINIENNWQHFLTFKTGYGVAMEEMKQKLEDTTSQIKYLIQLLELEGLETRAEYFDAKEFLEKLSS